MQYTDKETRDWKKGLQTNFYRMRKRIKKQQNPEKHHADHPSRVHMSTTPGKYILFCCQCRVPIVELTDEEYQNYCELFPKVVRRVSK